jgi:hypothetical protein
MKKTIHIILITILLFPLFSILGGNANAETNEIKVAINEGTFDGAFTIDIESAIDDFHWVVNNTEYIFSTEIINYTQYLNNDNFLTPQNFHLLIIDGVVDETNICCIKI